MGQLYNRNTIVGITGGIAAWWLSISGFKLRTIPAFVHYHKNHFLEEDESFDVTLYLPIEMY